MSLHNALSVAAFDKPILFFFAPLVVASTLNGMSDLPAPAVAGLALAAVAILALFAVVGKLIREDPAESIYQAVLIGIASGLLSIALSFAGEIANPFVTLSLAMVAAYKGPGFLKAKTKNDDDDPPPQ
tara:strand:+ start:19975 stop:20358 length:384 start_codon:yes stop_codon:yes gene_type:complete